MWQLTLTLTNHTIVKIQFFKFLIRIWNCSVGVVFKKVISNLPTLPKHMSWLPVFNGVRVTQSLVLCVCFVDRCLSFFTFSYGHYVVCSSSIYRFWLPLWHLTTYFCKIWYKKYNFLSLDLLFLSFMHILVYQWTHCWIWQDNRQNTASHK